MIEIACPSCGVKLSAKDKLAGQTRNCPKCKHPIQIPGGEPPEESIPLDDVVIDSAHVASQDHGRPDQSSPRLKGETSSSQEVGLPHQDLPERLNRQSHYLICDKSRLIATWENNGHGWMLKTSFGLVSANRNYEQLAAQGDFKLIELKLDMTDDGLKLVGIRAYQLAKRYALTTLDKGDDKIIGKITGPGFLNREQKHVVRKLIKEQFMRHVWENADEVLDYLGNTDYHSSGVG